MGSKRGYTGDTSARLGDILRENKTTLRKVADAAGCSHDTLLNYTKYGSNIGNMRFGLALCISEALRIYPEDLLLKAKNDQLRGCAESIRDRRGFESGEYYALKTDITRLERENYIMGRELEYLKQAIAQDKFFNGKEAQAANDEYLQSFMAKTDADVHREIMSRVRNDIQSIKDLRNGNTLMKM